MRTWNALAKSPAHGNPSTGSLPLTLRLLRGQSLRALQRDAGTVERKLSAILAADVAGYSRLMHNDEEATHAKLTTLLSDAVAPAIADHGGRIVKRTGDGFLAEFPSAVEAVRAAVQLQTRIKELTARDAEDRRIAFRVGMNVGDVIVGPRDVFGDGVNIAARLESIAEPGGICISSSVQTISRAGSALSLPILASRTSKISLALFGPLRLSAGVQPADSSGEHWADHASLGGSKEGRCGSTMTL